MILFRIFLDGASIQVQTLPKQAFEKSLPIAAADIKITAPLADLAKFPLGTVFITDGYDFPEPDHLYIRKENVMGLFFEKKVYPIPGKDANPLVDYLIDYMMDNEEYGLDVAKEYAEMFKAHGYEYDADKKFAVIAPGDEIPAGTNLKRTIAASYPVPTKKDCGFHIEPDIWYLLVRNVLRGENTLLIGPTGSGKTEILNHLAKAMGKELHIQDMGTVQDAQSALLGVHRLDKSGHSVFEYAPFVGHIKSNAIVLLDELNR